MKKTIFLLSLFFIFITVYSKVYAVEEKLVISAKESAILANNGDIIDLNNYAYHHDENTILSLSDVKITAYSSGIEISNLKITVKNKGIHPFLLQYQSANLYIYIIAKESNENEYILYQEDFTGDPNGRIPSDYTIVSGSAGIQNERLFVTGRSGSAIILLPSYLQSFMNYVIEADMTIGQVDNDARWASLMFRYNTENYFQMAVRKDATVANGVEFAKRISGNWNVTNTTSFEEKIDITKMYNMKIDVLDSTITEFFNGEEVLKHEQAFEFKRGRIGVQANGAEAYYDNFKITLPVSYIRSEMYEFTSVNSVYEPETKIVNPATTLTEVQSKAQVNEYLNSKRPATLIFNVNKDLDVISDKGENIGKLYDYLVTINGQMIPAIKSNEKEILLVAAKKFKDWGILDVFFISNNQEALKEVRKIHGLIRTVLDYSDNLLDGTTNQINQIAKITNETGALAVILNSQNINKALTQALQMRLVSVWTKIKIDGPMDRYKVILSGVNGIITPNPINIFEVYEKFTQTTHLREVFFISHRGLHDGYNNSFGPENSIEVALAAYNHGARIIEIDVHLTSDQKVVVMHDNTTTRTTNGNLTVANSTLDALMKLELIDISGTTKTFNVPSYEQFLDAFKDKKDVIFFVEIKPTNKMLIEKVKEVTNQMNMQDNVAMIMFAGQNAIDFNEVMPEVSRGYLTGALLNSANLNQNILSVLTSVVPMKTTLNPSYAPVTPEVVKALTHRGITVWPWTVDNVESMVYNFNSGVGGITTNVLDEFKETYLRLKYDNYRYEITKEDSFKLEGYLETLNLEKYTFRSNVIMVTNGAGLTFDNTGKLTSVEKNGISAFYTQTTTTLPDGQVVTLVSDMITVEVKNKTNSSMIVNIALISVGTVAIIGTTFVGIKIFKRRER